MCLLGSMKALEAVGSSNAINPAVKGTHGEVRYHTEDVDIYFIASLCIELPG